jgi:hypothetical protein
MKRIYSLLLFTILYGCASELNPTQKLELEEVKKIRPDIYTEEKNPVVGAFLGLILGGGSFYTGNIGSGIINLFFWPGSMFWDPINGYNGALYVNYNATKSKYQLAKERGEVKEVFFNK